MFGFDMEEERKTVLRACVKATHIIRNNPQLYNELKQLALAGRLLVERGAERKEDMDALLGLISIKKVLEEDKRIKEQIRERNAHNINNGKAVTLTAEEREALHSILGYCVRQLEETQDNARALNPSLFRMENWV